MLEGELVFTVEDEEIVAGPGTFVLVPPGLPARLREPLGRGRAVPQRPCTGGLRPAPGRGLAAGRPHAPSRRVRHSQRAAPPPGPGTARGGPVLRRPADRAEHARGRSRPARLSPAAAHRHARGDSRRRRRRRPRAPLPAERRAGPRAARLPARRRLGARQPRTRTTTSRGRSPTRVATPSSRSTTGWRPSIRSRPASRTPSRRPRGRARTPMRSAATPSGSRSAGTRPGRTSRRS